ncbi:hypothetical protein AURDEDRAFT_153984 [Auricularia subglabra TFB-10046 SS5]|nr:hypothetical protein AURDEDRAFT_153984 [Auricularia subglabra TFB-10046 SS5]
MCCSTTEASCTFMPYEGCQSGGASAQCLNVGGVTACGVNEGYGALVADGAPCGVYVGTSAHDFVQSLQGSATSPLSIDMAARHVLQNWPALAYEDNLAMCCTATSCGITAVYQLLVNPCNAGACALKCAGDAHYGICSTWCGNGDSGQYFLVNADAQIPASDSPETKPQGASSSTVSLTLPTAPSDSSTPAASHSQRPSAIPQQLSPAAPHSRILPTWSIAAIAVTGVVVPAAVTGLCIWLLRRRSKITALPLPPAPSTRSLILETSGGSSHHQNLPPKYAGLYSSSSTATTTEVL